MARPDWSAEVIFTTPDTRVSLAQAHNRGTVRRLGRGVYTRCLDADEVVVRRNLWPIVAHLFPGAVISDRCGRRFGIDDGVLTIVHTRRRPVELPGVVLDPRSGPGPITGDCPLPDNLWGASPERALLDNIAGSGPRYLDDEAIEAWICDIAGGANGANRLNAIRDNARRIAPALGREAAARRLGQLIAAALTTGPADVAATPVLRAWAEGAPYDRVRVERFERLAAHLANLAPEPLPALPADEARRALLPFYESYFSNYIEGTEFSLDEAAAIVFDDRVPANRPKDAHDILGVFRIVSDNDEIRRVPHNADEFIAMLLRRHGVMLDARPEANPGRFKARANQAGSTLFVAPDLVEATLRTGFEAGRGLLDPFARAVFMGFVVSEVHPFADGNGRMSRIFMNAELAAAGQVRIIVPTVYRLNYLAALKGATNNNAFESLVAVLYFAQRWTGRLDLSNRATAERDLARTNALRDPNEAEDAGVHLVLP